MDTRVILVLLTLTWTIYSSKGYCHDDIRLNSTTCHIRGICGQGLANFCGSNTISTYRLWSDMRRKAIRMDNAINTLYDAIIRDIASGAIEASSGNISCLLPLRESLHIYSLEEYSQEQIRQALIADFRVLEGVVCSLMKMRGGCSRDGSQFRQLSSPAVVATKQLMCQVSMALSHVGGSCQDGTLTPVLPSWCKTCNCFNWSIRNMKVADLLRSVSFAVKNKYTALFHSINI